MPELPEVQTTVNGLNKKIKGLKITDVWSDWHKIIKNTPSFGQFRKNLLKERVSLVKRKGKNILIFLSGHKVLLVHQKMTGHLMVGSWTLGKKAVPVSTGPLAEKINGYIHFVVVFQNGLMMALSDVRKFAKIVLLDERQIEKVKDLANIGPDPLDKRTTFAVFKKALYKKPNGKIKQVLMDQEVVSGIGNIYSDEILWFARVHPLERIKDLKDDEIKKIFYFTKKILKFSIKIGGDSMSDYRNIFGKIGGYQKQHKVYRRTGQKCFRCSTNIQRIKIGGRSGHFCPKCQKQK
jgi:formamidopyrimidine-DNA glycosylase